MACLRDLDMGDVMKLVVRGNDGSEGSGDEVGDRDGGNDVRPHARAWRGLASLVRGAENLRTAKNSFEGSWNS